MPPSELLALELDYVLDHGPGGRLYGVSNKQCPTGALTSPGTVAITTSTTDGSISVGDGDNSTACNLEGVGTAIGGYLPGGNSLCFPSYPNGGYSATTPSFTVLADSTGTGAPIDDKAPPSTVRNVSGTIVSTTLPQLQSHVNGKNDYTSSDNHTTDQYPDIHSKNHLRTDNSNSETNRGVSRTSRDRRNPLRNSGNDISSFHRVAHLRDSKAHRHDRDHSERRQSQRHATSYSPLHSSVISPELSSPRIRNDYSQHFVDTGQRPQNFIRDIGLKDRFSEYPKLEKLVKLKDRAVEASAPPAMWLSADLLTFDLESLGSKFDVIYIDPPWEEYARRTVAVGDLDKKLFWTFEELQTLKIKNIAEKECFLFMWCGSTVGLEHGRALMQHWGFRRCEDICWVKTNTTTVNRACKEPGMVFQCTKEHCLMGIKGTVRRNRDGHIIHSNIDTDVIVSEEPPPGSLQKPEELYTIIEHFCNGRRRLELFGDVHNIRRGWVTIGNKLLTTFWDPKKYQSFFVDGIYVPTSSEVEELRPKSPTRNF
ncbi:N6-adenosine-methyltransferase non-catalytic subunit [Pelomyxa schiedti]|nr:N6-adenosine-methyltransferase non-catalytic subunit [Pelomyxa schiedti]